MAHAKNSVVRNRRADAGPPGRFGVHCSIAGGVARALEEAQRLRCPVLQLFVKNQRQWQAPPLAAEDVAAWHALRTQFADDAIVAHATYLINIASPEATLRAKSAAALVDELARCHTLGVSGLVLHPGAATDGDREAGVRRVAETLNTIHKQHPEFTPRVLLESTAGQGHTLGNTFAELAAMIALLETPARVGICIDTCHVFAAGYDLRDAAGYARLVDDVEEHVGSARVVCWHINDCKSACGSRVDRHEHIGHGQIGTAGLRRVIGDARWRGLPMILETAKELDEQGREWDKRNLTALRRMATQAEHVRRGS